MKELKATREGFGEGLMIVAKQNSAIWALTANLASSTGLLEFSKEYPERFVEAGVAEQNLVTVASGLAHTGKIPFATSFAVFSPGRNWEQIRTTICYNNQPVKIVGSHTGLDVGEDGATHQALEDIALMRVLPNMEVIVPCDFIQAKKATIAISKTKKPTYLRLTRKKSLIITKETDKFEIGKAQILIKGQKDVVTIIGCGPLLVEALIAAEELKKEKINCTIINMHTIKPLDEQTILTFAKKTGKIITIEDHQVAGGLGSAISELLSEKLNLKYKMKIMGVENKFGESGTPEELYEKHKLNSKYIKQEVKKILK